MSGKAVLSFLFLFLSAAVCFGEGEVKELRQYEYWDNGKIRSCAIYDVDGRLKAKAFCGHDGVAEKVEKFDVYGNKISEALYDAKGKLKTGIDGWAAMRWWYDGSQLVSQVSYDENGVPMDKRIYSESGRLILRQYRDSANFDPYEGASMAMLLGNRNIPYYDPVQRTEK